MKRLFLGFIILSFLLSVLGQGIKVRRRPVPAPPAGGSAFAAKVGSFAANTATASQTVDTGTGVEGKAVLLWGKQTTATGDSADAEMFFGCATSSTAEWSWWTYTDEPNASSVARRSYSNIACITILTAAGTAEATADFTSFGTGASAGQFTINWSDLPSAAYIINYLFLGGTDITGATAGVFNFKGSTGTQDITSPGFQPDFVLLSTIANANTTAAPTTLVAAMPIIGMATSTSARGVCSYRMNHNIPAWDANTYQRSTAIFLTPDIGSAPAQIADFSAFLSTGFQINWTTYGGTATTGEIFFLTLQGGQYQVGNFTTQTSTGNFNVSSSFQGSAVLLMSTVSADATDTAGVTNLSVGAASSSTERACVSASSVSSAETADTRVASDRVYINLTSGTPTLNGDIDFVSFSSTLFTLNQTDADASGQLVFFALFGAE